MWRSEDEMLEVVRQRAARVRSRRRAVGTGAAAAVVLVCAATIVLTGPTGDGSGHRLQVAASGPTTTSTTAMPSVEVTTLPFPTTSAAVAAQRPPTSTASNTTVTTAAPDTVPVAPATAADEAPSTTAAPVVASCGPEDALATTTVDKQTYLPGQPVRITSTLQNVSGRMCEAAARVSGSSIEITNAAGVPVYVIGGMITHADCFVVSPDCSWPAGETETTRPCWDQTDTTTNAQVPTGTYTVTITWMGPVGASASATFQIVPDPAAPTTTMPTSRCP